MPATSWASAARPFIHATCEAGTPARAASPESVSPGWTVYPPMGAGALEDGEDVVPLAAVPVVAPCCSVRAASPSAGIITVEPSTTFASGESPLNAASERVVKLLAAAIVHRVSPGPTVCGTAAGAEAAMVRVARPVTPASRSERMRQSVSHRPQRPCNRRISFL